MEDQQGSNAGVRKRRQRGEIRKGVKTSPLLAPPMASTDSSQESILENTYRKLGEGVGHSIVTVKDPANGNYSVGFVAGHAHDHKATFIFTGSTFPDDVSDLLVRFKDGTVVQASVHVRRRFFSLLTVKYNAEFKPVKFTEEDVSVQTEAVIFVPTTESSCSLIPSFITQPSNPERDVLMKPRAGSADEMLVSCRYDGKLINDITNLASSPIFNLKGEVVGIVSFNLNDDDPDSDIKCGIRASMVKRLFVDFLKEAEYSKAKASTDH